MAQGLGTPDLRDRKRRGRSPGKQLAGSHQRQPENEECGIRETRRKDVLRRRLLDFLGGAVVENLPANAGDTGSGPGPGGSHMLWSSWAHEPQLLSLRSGAREPQLLKSTHLKPVLHNRRGHCNERPMHRSEEWPPLAATGEGPRAAKRT